MTSEKTIITADQLEFRSISADTDCSGFDCDDEDLNSFLRDDAFQYQEQKIAQTTCLFFKGRLVAYFAVCNDSIRLSEDEKAKFPENKQIPSYPAVKLARMACVKEHQRCGLGKIIIEIVIGMAVAINKNGVACRYVTVDAYRAKESWYEKRGFIRNQARSTNGPTVSMRKDIFS